VETLGILSLLFAMAVGQLMEHVSPSCRMQVTLVLRQGDLCDLPPVLQGSIAGPVSKCWVSCSRCRRSLRFLQDLLPLSSIRDGVQNLVQVLLTLISGVGVTGICTIVPDLCH
jgi:hypothetical protein